MTDAPNISKLEAARDAAYFDYTEAARRLHAQYWDRIQEQLPEIIRTVAAQYPGATVEAIRTEWTNSDEFMFDHLVEIHLPIPLTHEAELEFYGWLAEAIPLSCMQGQTIALSADSRE